MIASENKRAHSSWKSADIRQFTLRTLAEVILLFACILPGLVLSYKSLQGPWSEFRIARSAISIPEQRLATFVTNATAYRSEHSGGELLLTALIAMTSWPLERVVMLPVGSLALAILYYAIARQVTRSPWAAAAITLFASWYYPRLISQYSSDVYAWTNSLLLTFLILLWYWLRSKTQVLSLLIIAVFVALFLYYHTTPLWVIVILAVVTLAGKLGGSSSTQFRSSTSWALPLFCIVLYFAFDTVMFGDVLARFQLEVIAQGWFDSLIGRVAAPLVGRTPDIMSPFVIGQVNPRIATWTTLLILLMLVPVVGIWCLLNLYRMARTRHIAILAADAEDIFCWAIIAAAIIHAMLYTLYGSISLRVVPLAFPLIVPLMLRKFKLNRLVEIFWAWTLAALAVVGFLSYASTLQPGILASETGLVHKLFRPEDRLLGDANTYGSILLASASDGQLVGFVWPTPATYAMVIGRRPMDPDIFDYLTLDLSGKPITANHWVLLEPWTEYLQEIVNNVDLDKIYDNAKIMVFQPSQAELPPSVSPASDIQTGVRSVLGDAFRVFVAILALFIFPGAVVVFILHDTSLLTPISGPPVYGLVVGLSIMFTTFIGYVVNFTPLGLAWYIPLCVVLPWVALVMYFVARRPRIQIHFRQTVRILLFMTALMIWALLSAWVAQMRTDKHPLLTEFYVTQADSQSNSIEFHAVNRSDHARAFEIVLQANSITHQVLGSQLVPPNTSWTRTWRVPSDLAGERLSIFLEEDDSRAAELSLSLR